jgi:hypothetical protein
MNRSQVGHKWKGHIQVYTICSCGVMEDYPRTLSEFEGKFSWEEACRRYLYRLRWPNEFECPRCGHGKTWPVGAVLYQRARCGYQLSVIGATIFHATHRSLALWFLAVW